MIHSEIRGIKIIDYEDTSQDKVLFLNSNKLKRSFRYLKKYDIKSIQIDVQFFEQNNLECLKNFDCSKISKVCIDKDFNNLNGLFVFENLQSLTVTDTIKKPELDFSILKNLKYLKTKWSPNYTNYESLKKLKSCTLRYIKEENLNILANLNNLERLELVYGTVKSLNGIENLSKLKEIHLYYLKNIKSFEGISKSHENLDLFFTYNIPNIEKISNLGKAKNLRSLSISKTNIKYDSFKFLDNLKKLERLKIVCEKVSDDSLKSLEEARNRAPWN